MITLSFVYFNQFETKTTVNNHYHSCYEVIYYMDAEGVSEYYEPQKINDSANNPKIHYLSSNAGLGNKKEFEFKNNYCILYPPHTVHNESHIKVHNACSKILAVGFQLNDEPFSPDAICMKDGDLILKGIFSRILDEYENRNIYYSGMIEALIKEVLINIYRTQSSGSYKSDPIHYAKSFIKEYFTTNIDLNQLAEISGYSAEHFRMLFKKHTGMSPKAYILTKRLDYAKELLVKTDLPLTEIASMCGFNDYSQFNVFFKSNTKLNPKDYRAANII